MVSRYLLIAVFAVGPMTRAWADPPDTDAVNRVKAATCDWYLAALKVRVAEDNDLDPAPRVAALHDQAFLDRARAGAAACRPRIAAAFPIVTDAVVATLLQTAGQIVVDRAASNAWGLLSKQLRAAAGCDVVPPVFEHVCAVLADVRLRDLIASPHVLLDAAVGDAFAMLRDVLQRLDVPDLELGAKVSVSGILVGALDAWRSGGQSTAFAYLRSELIALIADAASDLATPCGIVLCRALRIAGSCLVSDGAGDQPIARCDVLAAGGARAADFGAVRRVALMIEQALLKNDRTALIRLFTLELRELVEQAPACAGRTECTRLVESLAQMLEGIVEADWSRVAAGAIASLRAGAGLGMAQGRRHHKLFALLAGVGQYAATYASKDQDQAAVAAARKRAIESLMDATTDRSGRVSGVVVSVGGDFGIGWGLRRNMRADAGDVKPFPTPLHLSLGFAVDQYNGSEYGMHAMLGVADLSQYLSFKDRDFTVIDPDAKAALAIGVTAGVRFALRSSPWFAGASFTYAPFVQDAVRSTSGSYQLLFLTAIYIPFLDLN